jgi:hypothetical protein
MKKHRLPATDSIRELAKFWDTHEVTDFEGELKVVSDPVFARSVPIQVRLPADELSTAQPTKK